MNKVKSGKTITPEKEEKPKTVQDWKRNKAVKDAEKSSGKVTAKHWIHKPVQIKAAGKKVKDLLKKLKDLWKLEDDQAVSVNSEEASHNQVLNEGDVVEFVKKSSQKGF